MFDFIKNHAIENIWCTPDQDTQIILEPARITPPTGVLSAYKVLKQKINLPDKTSYWGIYQIGQFHPLILGMFAQTDKWVSFAHCCNTQKMICDIYTINGIEIPRFDTFYRYTSDRNLIVAIKKNSRIPFDFINDKIFIRLYGNEYFNSLESDAIVDKIYVNGKKIDTQQEIVDIQNEIINYKSLNGCIYSFVNGYKVSDINLVTAAVGDVVEFVYDSSINKIVEFQIRDLETFDSTLDSKVKYLLHPLGDDPRIEYFDDIDFFIIDSINTNYEKGIYFHKNNKDTVRMLTHRDYTIPVAYVLGFVDILQAGVQDNHKIDPENLIIRLHIRKSGYNRSVVYDNNRIKELYKMTDTDIVRAMVGIDSVVENWRADTLESSPYAQIMQSKYLEITNTVVQNAYGYNAMSKIIGDTPNKTYLKSSKRVIDVPYGLQNNSTMYEYDSDGVMLEQHFHPNGSIYTAVNPRTQLVEIISGYGSKTLNDVFGRNNVPVPSNHDYRVYKCNYFAGAVDNNWVDVTDTSAYFIKNGKINWTDTIGEPYIRVRDTSNFLCYDLNLQANLGVIKFSLNNIENREGVTNTYVMQVPMGELDIFLNGRSLIANLDYFINFPEVVIINKEYLINPLTQVQKIHIRFTGFCDNNLQLTKSADAGFIEYGFLSNDNEFDIRDDKVLRIVVDGFLKTRQDVLFSEDHSGVSIINAINGKPYSIRDIVVPLNGLTSDNTYNLRQKSIAIDKAISNYLTLKVPQPPRPGTSVIEARYQVFSPFICKIIYDLNIGVLSDPRLLTNFSDNVVTEVCKPYEDLLAFDPITDECALDSNYVIIHPHNLFTVIELDFFAYRFVERVVKLYARGLVNLSAFLRIKAITIS